MRKLIHWVYTEYLDPERITVPVIIKLRSFVFASAVAKTSIGLWLLYPGYDTFDSNIAYDTIKTQITEVGLGFIFLVLGVLSLYGIAVGSTRIRIVIGYSSLLLYLYLAAMFALSNFYGLAIPLWGTMVVCEFINCTVFNRDLYKQYNPKEE